MVDIYGEKITDMISLRVNENILEMGSDDASREEGRC